MQGKILIVDAIATHRIMFRSTLRAAYYEVVQATTIEEALSQWSSHRPDLILTALDLPDGEAASLCVQVAQLAGGQCPPVIALGPPADMALRLRTLKAGVHEVLGCPVDKTLLLGRIRNLIRAHNAAAEWQMRDDTWRALGLAEPRVDFEEQCSCMMIHADAAQLQKYAVHVRRSLRAKLFLCAPQSVMASISAAPTPDGFVLILSRDDATAMQELQVISNLRAAAQARHTGVLVIQTQPNPAVAASALDLGADDLMTDGFNAAELILRLKALIRRKRMSAQMRATVRTGLQAAVFDPLTGLYNRRYAMPHLERISEHATATRRSFAVMVADLDHFKAINDRYGHAAGDAVLIELANRLRSCLRHTDMVARIGGEEFLIILPGTDLDRASEAAARVCSEVSDRPFPIPGQPRPIAVTISIGMAIGGADSASGMAVQTSATDLLAQADQALYAAKGRGRNQVNLARPAA